MGVPGRAPEYAAQIDDQHTEILLQRALSQSAPPSDQHSPLTERPALICLADVEAREVDWLWNSYIPIGMLSMISGDPGVGKSYIAMSIAAELSRGRSLDGRNIEPGTTLYLTRENPIAESIRPRFDMLGGHAERLILLEGKSISTDVREEMIPIELGDVNTLASALQETKARLMIVDPI